MRGFTLIETVIYIALLGLIMGGTLAIVYQLMESSGRTSGNTTVQEEGNFVLRKLDWALGGTLAAPTIGGSGCSQDITISKTGFPNLIKFRLNAGAVEIATDSGGNFVPITTSNVTVSCLKFLPVSSGSITGVAATTTINGLDFATTKYKRI